MVTDDTCTSNEPEQSSLAKEKEVDPTTIENVATKFFDQPLKPTVSQHQEIIEMEEIIPIQLSGGQTEIVSEDSCSQDEYLMRSVASVVCRICHNAENPERLISPCLCKGTLAYVHRQCLEHWLSTSGIVACELCNYRFHTKQTLRYTCIQSLRLWYNHPNNRGLLQADFLVCSLLTVVSFGLVGISMMALQYFFIQGKRLGVSRLWTQFSILVFLVVISTVYCVNMGLILKAQLVPWYRWWQSAKDVTLILDNKNTEAAPTSAPPQDRNTVLEEVVLESSCLSVEPSTQPPKLINEPKNPMITV